MVIEEDYVVITLDDEVVIYAPVNFQLTECELYHCFIQIRVRAGGSEFPRV